MKKLQRIYEDFHKALTENQERTPETNEVLLSFAIGYFQSMESMGLVKEVKE